MKPNFALNLSHDGISLLHRAPGGWSLVGSASLTDPDLTEALGYLRQTAVALGGGRLGSKLIVPNSQILYTEIELTSDATNLRVAQIRAALSDMTPYAVDELVFDWHESGGVAKVAAVARETLEEAEAFASEHRFNPLSFVAIPAVGQFEGEAYFGATEAASTILGPGETVERDAFAIKIVPLPETLGPAVSAPNTAVTMPDQAPEADADQVTPTKAEEPIPAEPKSAKPKPAPVEVAAPLDVLPEEPASDPDAGVENPDAEVDNLASKTGDTSDADGPDAPEEPTTVDSPAKPDAKPNTKPVAEPTAPVTKAAPIILTVSDAAPVSASRSEVAPPAPKAAFATRRTDDAADSPDRIDRVPARLVVSPVAGPESAPALGAAQKEAAGITARIAPDLPPPTRAPIPEPAPTPEETPPPSPTTPAAPATKPVAPGPDAADLTVFGARKPTPVRGRPRFLGLFLTLALLVIFALIALWSLFFLDEPLASFFGGDETPTTEVAALADLPLTSQTLPSDGASEITGAAPAPEQVEMSLVDAEVAYANTGVWQRAPEAPVGLGSGPASDFYIVSIDPEILSHDAVALPQFDANPGVDQLPLQPSPAPFGTEFTLDDRGFVVPDADGNLNADGILVFAGRPSVIPPARPAQAAVAQLDTRDTPDLATLAGYRPRARPGNLSELHERGLYGGLTRVELAQIRPPPRPVSAQEEQGTEEPGAPPSDYAIARSLVPESRPADFAAVVEAARARIAANPPEEDTSTASSSAAGQAPSIPTRASVADQATVRNAINLNQVSLIGVYGTSSERRALVRLRNGRYVRVSVGDRMAGGHVAAIGEQELRYVRGGRNITLRMPDT